MEPPRKATVRSDVACLNYPAVADAELLTGLSVSTPVSNTPLPLQSFQDVTTYV